MDKHFSRAVIFLAVLTGVLILADLIIDFYMRDEAWSRYLHIFLGILILFSAFFTLIQARASFQRAESTLRRAHDELEIRVQERTRQLTCLYGISNLAGRPDITLEDILQMIVDLLPSACNEPDRVCARIVLDGREYRTRNYQGTPWRQTNPIAVHGRQAGFVEISSLKNKRAFEEQPFSLEEIHMLNAITERVGRIAERIQAEEALRASEEKFSTVFRCSPDAIAIIKASDFTFLEINESFTKFFGHTQSEVIGKTWKELGIIISTNEWDQLITLYREEGKVADYELDFNTKQAELSTMLLSLASIPIEGEARLLAITHDITGHKRSEEALRQAQAELASGIQQRIALEERQRLARELHDSVSQALYGISLGTHTALTLFDTDQTKVREALNYILSQAQAGLTEMRALIFELRPESLEREGLISALTKQSAAVSARYGLEIEVNLCEEPNIPLSSKEVLYRIAQEALQNAVKHSQAKQLKIRLACEPDTIRLDIQDNGVGFDPQAEYPGHLGLRSMPRAGAEFGRQVGN